MSPSAVPVETLDHLPIKAKNATNGTENTERLQLEGADKIDTVLRTFRCLIADLCQQFGGGHPGSAMGMAAIGIALWNYTMKYSPTNPDFFNRDRFVLSNGHACLFQYTFLHLTGFRNMTWEQLKTYHSSRPDSYCPGHPEIEHEGVEVTTGPLGQGVANAVGFAMATKHLGARYNRPNFPVVDNTTWCLLGDACLQEGVALEAIQLAGHWKLNNLVLIYDDNSITCDGTTDMIASEDINAKMAACGFNVITVDDGNHDVEGIVKALIQARASKDKPSFIHIKTLIGIGSAVAGNAKAHGVAYGVDDVKSIKKNFGMSPEEHFVMTDEVRDFFNAVRPRGQKLVDDWNALVDSYTKEHPDIAAEFKLRREGQYTEDWVELLPKKEDLPTAATASRKSSGIVCNVLADKLQTMMVGTADLTPSVNMAWKGYKSFQHPDLRTVCGEDGDYTGRYIHWGIREHAMASISNGLAAYNKGTILPVTSSFFMFYIYAAPGIRMGALQQLQAIHIATHDSIGTGEDGPTHQPIELAALYRAMPNLLYIRPADSEEVVGAYTVALKARNTPSMISLSRQGLEQYPQHSRREGVERGAYVFIEEPDADVTLIGVGPEMCFAVQTRELLAKDGIKARVVSFPCQRIFDKQPVEYKREVLGYQSKAPRVVIEAYSQNGWEKYADAGWSMHSFGHSLPGKVAYKHFGFDAEAIAPQVKVLVEDVKKNGIESLRGEFRDLNNVNRGHADW